jgi:hypothetical protein
MNKIEEAFDELLSLRLNRKFFFVIFNTMRKDDLPKLFSPHVLFK